MINNNIRTFSFSYGLEKECREDLYKDFEQLTLDFYHKGNLYGLEKYWYVLPAFAHFGNLGQNHLELDKFSLRHGDKTL